MGEREDLTPPNVMDDSHAADTVMRVLLGGRMLDEDVLGEIALTSDLRQAGEQLVELGVAELLADGPTEMRVRLWPSAVCEVTWSQDWQRVWVNAPDGSCIGRFDRRGHVDVHASAIRQFHGVPECLDCAHGGSPDEMWEQFQAGMLKHYRIELPRPSSWPPPSKATQLEIAGGGAEIETGREAAALR